MLKRTIDVLVSFVLLSVLLPLFILLAVVIRFRLGSPVLFSQMRPGCQGKPFRLVKFRTMSNRVGNDGMLLSDAQRLCRFGRFLRSCSLDELPELWNVLKGDMSLVGPRPLLMEYMPLYTKEQHRRHEMRPGITGLAQISGRNALAWEDKFKLDVFYVTHHSFFLDIKILVLTLKKVFCREGVEAAGEATTKKFVGTTACEP